MNRRTVTLTVLVLMASALPQLAAADTPPDLSAPKLAAPTSEYAFEIPGSDGRRDGVDWQLSTGATFTLNNNASVVGQPDGSTVLFGFKLDGLVNFNHAEQEWRSTLGIGEGLARTPLVDELVKSRDALSVESIFLYHIVPWFGPYSRLVLDTSMFRGADVRPEQTDYVITRRDGTEERRTAKRLALTDPFRPLALKESLGLFARPVTKDQINFEVRAGAGARETIARGQLAIADDATTPVVEVKELDSVIQLGVEATAQLWGAISSKRVLYRATADVMIPLAHNALPSADDRSAFDLTNVSLTGTLSFKLVEWASFDYEIRVVREPQLLDDFQVQNNVLFNFGFSTGTLPKAQ